jgi:hypothetical protein
MSEFQRLYHGSCLDAELHGEGHWPVNNETPYKFSEDLYVETMLELLAAYHTGAMVALERCNAHDRDSCHAPRVLLFDLLRHCWTHRVPLTKALPICSMFLRRCSQWLPSGETTANADSQ